MKIRVRHERSDDYMYEGLEIVIDDTYKFNVCHDIGTPEDNTMDSNFADCLDIPNMLERAYQAGKNGEKFEIEFYGDEE